MQDSPLDKLKRIAGTQAPTVPSGGISALKQKLEGMGFESKPLPAEVERENLTMPQRALANIYNASRAMTEGALEVGAAPVELAGILTGSETLRGAAEGIRGVAAIGEGHMLASDGRRLVEPGFGSEVAGGFGSAAGFMAGGLAMGGASRLAGAVGQGASRVAPVARGLEGALGKTMTGHAMRLGSITQAQSQFRDAEAHGADPLQKWGALLGGAAIGATEGLTIGGTGQFARAAKALEDIDTRGGGLISNMMRRGFVSLGTEGLTEAGQEGFQTFSEKALAQHLLQYAEPEELEVLLSDTLRGALLGGIVGTGLSTLGLTRQDVLQNRKVEALKAPESTQAAPAAPGEREAAGEALESAKGFEREEAPEAASVEDAGKRFAEAAGIAEPEVTVLEPDAAPEAGQEALAGLVSMLGREATGTTMPNVVLVSGEVAEGAADVPGLYIGGNVVLNANRVDEALADYGLHEILHSKIPAGTQQFTELVGRAQESYPELAARVAGAYARDFERAHGRQPFAGVPEGPKRDALLLEEGFAWAAQNTRALVEDIIGGEREITVGDRTILERLRDFFAALLSKLPRIDIKPTQKKKLEAAIRKLVSAPILREGSPEQVLALAKDIAAVLESTDADVMREAVRQVPSVEALGRTETLAEEVETEVSVPELTEEDAALAESVDVAAIEAEVVAESAADGRTPTKTTAQGGEKADSSAATDRPLPSGQTGATPARPDIDERLTPKQRKRLKQKRNRERKRQGKTEGTGPERTYRRDDTMTAAEDAIERFERGDERWAVAPDPGTDEWRAMVDGMDPKLKENGLPIIVYHGSGEAWTTYDTSKNSTPPGRKGPTRHVFATDSPLLAGLYAEDRADYAATPELEAEKEALDRQWEAVEDLLEEYGEGDPRAVEAEEAFNAAYGGFEERYWAGVTPVGAQVYPLILAAEKAITADAKGKNWDEVMQRVEARLDRHPTAEVAIVRNVVDSPSRADFDRPVTVYVANPSIIQSAWNQRPTDAPDIRFAAAPAWDTPEWRAMVDRMHPALKESTGMPREYWIGTTHRVTAFDPERFNPENDMGRGIYASSSREDVRANYAGDGPDLTNRIERRIDELADAMADEPDAFGFEPDYEVTPEDVEAEARRELHGGRPHSKRVYMVLENPAILGGPDETVLDMKYDPETDEESGALLEFWEALRSEASMYDDVDLGELQASVFEDFEGARLRDLVESVKSSGLQYAQDYDDGGAMMSSEIIRSALERMGFDGIVDNTVFAKFGAARQFGKPMEGITPDTQHVIAFRPNQVKSVWNRRPTSDPDIRFAAPGSDSDLSIDMGGLTFTDRARRYWQDYFRPVRKVQEIIEEDIGAKLPDGMNPDRAQRLYYGRVDEALKKQRESAGKQLSSILGGKVTLEEAHRFAYARHAGERNDYIYKNDSEWHPERNPGSGMRSSVATKAVNDALKGPNAARYKRLDRFLRKQTERALSTLREAGELSPSLDRAIEEQGYQHYVPLVHELEREDGSVTRRNPRGFSSTGAGIKRAKGRKSEPDNVVLNTLKAVDEAIFKAEKREVIDNLVKLVRAYPDDSFWKVYDMPVRIEADENGVMRELWETRRDWQDNYIPYYEDGKGKALVFGPKATGLARAMRGGDLNKVGPIVKALRPVTRYFSAINTSMNPEFVFTNFVRDLETAGIVLGEDKGWKVAKAVVKQAPSAALGIRRTETGKESDWSSWWDRLKDAGGKTGFFHAKSLEEIQADLERTIREDVGEKSGVRAGLDYAMKVKEVIDGWNEAVENGVRLSAFKYAVEELNMSDSEAAELSKTLTIDFNTKGENTTLSALYMFANASVQGSARVLASSMRTKRGRKIAGSIAAFGMLLDPLNYMLAGDDEDGENRWDAVPEWKKDRYLMLYTGIGESGFITIPLPYGFSFFYSAGRNASAAGRGLAGEGGVTPLEGLGNTLSSALTSFSPVGDAHNISAASALRVISPTVTDPLVEVAMNEDYRGMPIHPSGVPFDRTPLPDSERSFKHTGEIWKDAAELMNSATGGTRLESGAVDLHPDTLRHLFGTAFGGMMRFANNTAEGGGLLFEGDPLHALARAPFSRQLFTQEYPRKGYSSYYENSNEVMVVADLIEQYGKSDEPEDRERAQELREEHGGVAGLLSEVKRLERIRKRTQDRIEAMEDGPEKEAEEAKLYERIRAFNRRFQEAKNE